MSPLRIAHCVRRYGGLTEPFIRARIAGDREVPELWYENAYEALEGITAIRVRLPLLPPTGLVDRLFHVLPQIGPALAGGYTTTERDRRPDVLHAHYLTTAWLVGRRTTTPLVASAYGFDATAMARRRSWRRAFADLAARAAVVAAEGPFMRGTLIGLGFAEARIRVVPIAAGFEDVPLRADRPVGRTLRLVACGRLVEKKGLDVAIRAFAASGLLGHATLDVVGDGPLRSTLRQLIHDLGVGSSVRMVGRLDRRAWLALLGTADLFVAASRTASNGDAEGGAPTTILDAQATGVPVVGTTHCDIPYLIDDGRTGYLAPENDVAGLADALDRAIGHVSDWPDIVRKARGQVVDRHSVANVSALLQTIHREAAEG
jgi:colanic acid/amylovoran biosynthesis glycosyltransferase